MTPSNTQRVVLQPDTYQAMQCGINTVIEAIRPTLGPLPRMVAVEPSVHSRAPEVMDDGAAIVRRIIALPDRSEDVGAMYVRHLLWELRQQVGDGTATAAVMFQTVYNQAVRYLVAGGDPMRLRRHLEVLAGDLRDRLGIMAIHRSGQQHLAQVAESICADPPLAWLLGEVFDRIGPYGYLEIRSGRGRELEREYTEGTYWPGGVQSHHMLHGKSSLKVELDDAAILLSDLPVETPQEMVPVFQAAAQAGAHNVVIVASRLSESATALLLANQNPEKFNAIAVKVPTTSLKGPGAALDDMAILTGGRALLAAAGDTLAHVTAADLGRARHVWATADYVGVLDGRGDPHALSRHIDALRSRHAQASDGDSRARLQERIGRLMGKSAFVWVGAATEVEIDARKQRAERTVSALRGTLADGVLPGGGVALLMCAPGLRQRLDECTDADERAAIRMVIEALEQPFRTIVENAGYDPGSVLAQLSSAPPGSGLDARSGQIVEMAEAGIFNSAAMVKSAAHMAITGAALLLTVDVLVHHRKPQVAMEP